jgi:uncharacterized protein (DUF2249 family)
MSEWAESDQECRTMADLMVDIRPVPPRDRFDVIADSYRTLEPGGTLAFTFEHEPNGLTFALEAVAGIGSFRVSHTELGTRNWRAEVERVV